MAKHDDLIAQFLQEQGLDSSQTLTRTLTAVRQTAARQQRRQRWLQAMTAGSSLVSLVLLVLAWHLGVQQFAPGMGDQRTHGFHDPSAQVALILIWAGAASAAVLALLTGLTSLVRRWRLARHLAQVETSLPDPAQVLRQAQGMK